MTCIWTCIVPCIAPSSCVWSQKTPPAHPGARHGRPEPLGCNPHPSGCSSLCTTGQWDAGCSVHGAAAARSCPSPCIGCTLLSNAHIGCMGSSAHLPHHRKLFTKLCSCFGRERSPPSSHLCLLKWRGFGEAISNGWCLSFSHPSMSGNV